METGHFVVTVDTAGNRFEDEWPSSDRAEFHYRNRVGCARAWSYRLVEWWSNGALVEAYTA